MRNFREKISNLFGSANKPHLNYGEGPIPLPDIQAIALVDHEEAEQDRLKELRLDEARANAASIRLLQNELDEQIVLGPGLERLVKENSLPTVSRYLIESGDKDDREIGRRLETLHQILEEKRPGLSEMDISAKGLKRTVQELPIIDKMEILVNGVEKPKK